MVVTGWLIEYAKSKFKNIEGYEPTKELAEITAKNLNINIFVILKIEE